MINRTPPCRSRAGGNPSARQVRGWIPVSTGMTLACPNLRGDGYSSRLRPEPTHLGSPKLIRIFRWAGEARPSENPYLNTTTLTST